MDSQKAKVILQSYRPGGQDAADPLFAEALEQVRRDPELRAWFADQQTFDAAVREQLQRVPVPIELKNAILAQHKIVAPTWRARRFVIAALAAMLVVAATLAVIWLTPVGRFGRATMAKFEREMPAILSEGFNLEFLDTDATALQSWLRNRRSVDDFALPATVARLPGYGCRVLDWRGHKVAVMCFRAPDGKLIHLFTLKRVELPKFELTGDFHLARSREWATASWIRGDRVFLLATLGDEASLKSYLPPAKI